MSDPGRHPAWRRGLRDLHGRRTHTVTQADVDAGKVVDTATATGTDTRGDVSPPRNPSTRSYGLPPTCQW